MYSKELHPCKDSFETENVIELSKEILEDSGHSFVFRMGVNYV